MKKKIIIFSLLFILISPIFAAIGEKQISPEFIATPFGEMIIKSGKQILKENIFLKSCVDINSEYFRPLILSNQTIIDNTSTEHKRTKSIFITRDRLQNYKNQNGEYRVDYSVSFYTDEKLDINRNTFIYGSQRHFTPFTAIEKIEVRIWIFHNDKLVKDAPYRQVLPVSISVENVKKNKVYKTTMPPFDFKFTIKDFDRGMDVFNRFSFRSIEFDVDIKNVATFAGEPITTKS